MSGEDGGDGKAEGEGGREQKTERNTRPAEDWRRQKLAAATGKRRGGPNIVCVFGETRFAPLLCRRVKGAQSPWRDARMRTPKLTRIAVLPDMSAAAGMVTVPWLKIAPPEQRSGGGNREISERRARSQR